MPAIDTIRLTARVMTQTCQPQLPSGLIGSKGHDPNLPAIVTIRVGSKGHDPNLPAIVTIKVGDKVGSKGRDPNLPAIVPSALAARVFTQTCRP